MTELELLHRIKENPAAFSEIFVQFYKPIFGYIFRRTGSFDDTADIAADTFLKAFTYIHTFSYNGISIKVWLYRIATNELNQFFRNHQKHNKLFSRITLEDRKLFDNCICSDKEELEAELQKHHQFLTVLQSLKTLRIRYQEVISLKYFEGKANKEIAQILNINEGTVKSLLSRGLQKLKDKCNEC